MRRTLLAWGLAAAVLLPLAAGSGDAFVVAARVHGSESAEVERILDEELSSPFARFVVLVLTGVPAPDTPAGAEVLAGVRDRLTALPAVAGTFSYLDRPDPAFLGDAGGTFVVVGLAAEAGDPEDALESLRAATPTLLPPATTAASTPTPAAFWTGEVALNRDLRETSSRQATAAELRALPLTLGLLLLAFGTLVAAAIPVGAGFLGISIAMGAAVLAARFMELSVVLENTVSMIGLGLGIDYGLLVVSRFREEVAGGCTGPEAAARTRRHAGRTVAVSGLTVAVGFAALLVVPLNEIRSVAMGGLLVTVVSVLVATTLLPPVLGRLGRRVEAGRIGPRGGGPDGSSPAVKGWLRWGRLVVRRPGTVLAVAGLPLLLLASAAPRLATGLPTGDWLPADMESARGLAALEEMGRGGVVNTLRVVVPMPDGVAATDPEGWRRVSAVTRDLAGDARIARVQSLPAILGDAPPSPFVLGLVPPGVLRSLVSESGAHALVEAVPAEGVDDRAMAALVRELREDGDLLVGGIPALNVDYADAVAGRFPLLVLLVVSATFLGLAVAFRSVLIPLKAIALNLLTVSAAMGALVLVFQDGYDAGLLGVGAGTGGVFPVIPALVFCIVFGLSMDYEVFLVARVAEARRAGLGEGAAIAEGMARSGRVITSAAAVMIAVFAAFILGDFLLIRMLGFALAVAVLLDATVVRLALGPALLALAGRWNWWPGRIERPPRRAAAAGRSVPDHPAEDTVAGIA